MERIIAQIERLTSSADEISRRKIQEVLREVQYSLETPYDTLFMFVNLICNDDCPRDLPIVFFLQKESNQHMTGNTKTAFEQAFKTDFQ